jgi:CheY-like chemotaxis protein
MKKVKNIVLIDDNKIDCFVSQKIISLVNKNIVTKMFNSSVDALKYFYDTKIESGDNTILNTDIILLDINMPVLNGFQFINKLSKLEGILKSTIDVYFLSSSNNEEDISEALSFEFCSGYITKPLTKEKINTLLESKKVNDKQRII